MPKLEMTKEDVKAIINAALLKTNLSFDGMAWHLQISTSTLRGYRSKGYLPGPIFTQLKGMIENPSMVSSASMIGGERSPLGKVTTEALTMELEARGWVVELTMKRIENVLASDELRK